MRRSTLMVVVLAGLVLAGLPGCGLPPGLPRRRLNKPSSPTALAFAPDGRLFVAEKRGTIQTYDSVDDETPELFADLREQVQNTQDHGLLGIEVDPGWPSRPYVYAQYSYDAPVGGTAPTYGVGTDTDPCAKYLCPAQGRVARLTSGPGTTMTDLKVLTKDVCFAYYFHGGGGIRMAPDGSLVVSLGEGAFGDETGQVGTNNNFCNDPPYQSGSLRAQDIRTPADPTGLSGSVIRISPDTGAPWPTNPLINSPDLTARKMVAYGVRNPYRLTLRPGTSEVWLGDVGSAYAEEINRLNLAAPVENYGWPCHEGRYRNPDMDALNRPLCESLYTQGGDSKPYYSYCHTSTPSGQPCKKGGGAISGLAFYNGGNYPDKYDGALFFADYTRNNIRVMLPTGGIPDPAKVEDFANNIGAAVDLRVGPGGDLFYVDIFNGRIQRIYQGTAPPPDTTKPKAIIDRPAPGDSYTVGQAITFAGRAADADGAPLPASAMRWDLIQLHCPTETSCHRHFAESREGVASGSFIAPDHEEPSQLEIGLTVTSNGRTDTSTVVLTKASAVARAVVVSGGGRTGRTDRGKGFLVGRW